MSEIAVFDHPEFGRVRHVLIDGDPWFVAPDACKALTLRDTSSALKMVDDEDKMRLRRSEGPHFPQGLDNRVHEVTVVNESGLYALMFQSNKPQAKVFKRWITSEVLPAIRKTGGYGQVPGSFAEALEMAAKQQRAIEEQAKALAIAAPKAEIYDEWLESEAVEMTDYAKRIEFTPPRKFTATLREVGVLRRDKTHAGRYRNLPTKAWEYAFEVRPVHLANGEWIDLALITAQGQVDILEELRDRGLVS